MILRFRACFCGSFAALVNDSLNGTGEGCDGCVERVANGCKQYLSAGQLCKRINGSRVNDCAVKITALNCEVLVSIGELGKDSCGCGVIFGADTDSGGAFKDAAKVIKTCFLSGKTEKAAAPASAGAATATAAAAETPNSSSTA